MSYCVTVQRGENIWELTVCGRFTGIRVDSEERAKVLADQAEKVVYASGLPDLRIATEALIAAHCRGRAAAQAMLDNTRPHTLS